MYNKSFMGGGGGRFPGGGSFVIITINIIYYT